MSQCSAVHHRGMITSVYKGRDEPVECSSYRGMITSVYKGRDEPVECSSSQRDDYQCLQG